MEAILLTRDQRQIPITVNLDYNVMFIRTDKFKTAVDLTQQSIQVKMVDGFSTIQDTQAGISVTIQNKDLPIAVIDEEAYGYQMIEFQYSPQGNTQYSGQVAKPCFPLKQYCVEK